MPAARFLLKSFPLLPLLLFPLSSRLLIFLLLLLLPLFFLILILLFLVSPGAVFLPTIFSIKFTTSLISRIFSIYLFRMIVFPTVVAVVRMMFAV